MTSLHYYLTEKNIICSTQCTRHKSGTIYTLLLTQKSNSPYIPFVLFFITIYRTLRNANNTALFYILQYTPFALDFLSLHYYVSLYITQNLQHGLYKHSLHRNYHYTFPRRNSSLPFYNIVFVHHNHEKQITLFPFSFFCTPDQTIKCMRVSVYPN